MPLAWRRYMEIAQSTSEVQPPRRTRRKRLAFARKHASPEVQEFRAEALPTDGLMDTRQAGAYLNMSPLTLLAWRGSGQGPQWMRLGLRTIRYRRSALDAWLASCEKKEA